LAGEEDILDRNPKAFGMEADWDTTTLPSFTLSLTSGIGERPRVPGIPPWPSTARTCGLGHGVTSPAEGIILEGEISCALLIFILMLI
jgi:hypothetical protein